MPTISRFGRLIGSRIAASPTVKRLYHHYKTSTRSNNKARAMRSPVMMRNSKHKHTNPGQPQKLAKPKTTTRRYELLLLLGDNNNRWTNNEGTKNAYIHSPTLTSQKREACYIVAVWYE